MLRAQCTDTVLLVSASPKTPQHKPQTVYRFEHHHKTRFAARTKAFPSSQFPSHRQDLVVPTHLLRSGTKTSGDGAQKVIDDDT